MKFAGKTDIDQGSVVETEDAEIRTELRGRSVLPIMVMCVDDPKRGKRRFAEGDRYRWRK
ncbi:hypothetical protein [Neorhizobium alkalisoli]|uniref:hypothetical protein n=1 Tax=Neorhizobium alkalisoli TaxID=528178 RepID=UPI0016477E36|nr:hypothetical protein [Neorhizobium alkalisoli]